MLDNFFHCTDANFRPCKRVHQHQFTHFNRIILIITIRFWNWRVLSKTTRFDASIKNEITVRSASLFFKTPDRWLGEG